MLSLRNGLYSAEFNLSPFLSYSESLSREKSILSLNRENKIFQIKFDDTIMASNVICFAYSLLLSWYFVINSFRMTADWIEYNPIRHRKYIYKVCLIRNKENALHSRRMNKNFLTKQELLSSFSYVAIYFIL